MPVLSPCQFFLSPFSNTAFYPPNRVEKKITLKGAGKAGWLADTFVETYCPRCQVLCRTISVDNGLSRFMWLIINRYQPVNPYQPCTIFGGAQYKKN